MTNGREYFYKTSVMKKHQIIFLIIFLFALVVKTISLLHWHGLTFDEMISADLAQKSLAEVFYFAQWETHPAFYYLLLNLWGHAFGQFERSWRALSLVISLASLTGIYFLAKELYGRKAGLIAMFLFSISVFFNFYGLWLRMYGLAIFFSIISFYLFIKIFNTKGKNYLWIIFYIIASSANLYTHLFSLFALLAQALFLLAVYLKKAVSRQQAVRLLISLGASFIIFLPWLIFGFAQKLRNLNGGAWYFSDHSDELLGIYAIITRLFVLTENAIIANIGLTILLIIFSSALVIIVIEKDELKIKLDNSNQLLYALLIFFVPLFLIMLIGLFRLRFFWLVALGLILVISYGLSKIKNLKWLTAALLLISLLSAPGMYSLARLTSSGWSEVGGFIAKNEKNGDVIVAAHPNHLLPLKFYYRGNLPELVIGNQEPYQQDLTRAILLNNIYSNTSAEEESILKIISADNQRIFLVYSGGGFNTDQDKIKNWFLENNWRLNNSYENKSLDHPGVWLLEKHEGNEAKTK
jgi:4-amino-4-deoxy-L-arabinose transferase-like glycosyltransferase